jgi:GT2 family glycosyltransferase
VHIIFDGCVDATEEKVRYFYEAKKDYPVTFEVTPDIFEVKTNNIGLKKSKGDYCIIMQDDTYIDDPSLFMEAVCFLDKAPRVAILGCLAGVNFYPRGTEALTGKGQIKIKPDEVYLRQDAVTDPLLKARFFEVDACMRGPLIIRREFLLQYGYLDEVYAPLYNDDMDICFRAKEKGYKVFAMLGAVRNASLTMAKYDAEKGAYFSKIQKRNTDIFYSRYTPSVDKRYMRVLRTPIRLKQGIVSSLSSKLFSSVELLMDKIQCKVKHNQGM